jgi:hypothetical protein
MIDEYSWEDIRLGGSAINVKRIINVTEKKFLNLKFHDCHVPLTQLLSVALRGILPPKV